MLRDTWQFMTNTRMPNMDMDRDLDVTTEPYNLDDRDGRDDGNYWEAMKDEPLPTSEREISVADARRIVMSLSYLLVHALKSEGGLPLHHWLVSLKSSLEQPESAHNELLESILNEWFRDGGVFNDVKHRFLVLYFKDLLFAVFDEFIQQQKRSRLSRFLSRFTWGSVFDVSQRIGTIATLSAGTLFGLALARKG